MINLIKNELFKLSHRIEPKILIIFAILATFVINFMNYFFSGNNERLYKRELESTIQFSEEMKNNSDNTIDDKIYYYSNYDIAKLKMKYPMYSAETGYINDTLSELSNSMYRGLFGYGADSEVYIEAKKEYEEAVKKLDNFDWKEQILDEISKNQESIDLFEKYATVGEDSSLKEEIEYFEEINRVLRYRLDNEIPYDNSNASELLTNYVNNLEMYKSMNNTKTHEEKYTKFQIEKEIYTTKYMINNQLIKEDKITNGYTTISEELISIASGSGFMLTFFVIFISSMIIPSEFEKGTIKGLLVKPYTRTEILFSKIIASILFFFGFAIIYLIINAIVIGIFAGFETIKAPIIEYNFNTHVATRVGLIPELLKCFLLALPRFLVTMIIAIMLSIFTKSIVLSMYIGFMLNAVDLSSLQKPIARFIVSNCWDFNVFANGGISANQYVALGSSIAVVIVTAVIALALSIWSFKRKEIKNQ